MSGTVLVNHLSLAHLNPAYLRSVREHLELVGGGVGGVSLIKSDI